MGLQLDNRSACLVMVMLHSRTFANNCLTIYMATGEEQEGAAAAPPEPVEV